VSTNAGELMQSLPSSPRRSDKTCRRDEERAGVDYITMDSPARTDNSRNQCAIPTRGPLGFCPTWMFRTPMGS